MLQRSTHRSASLICVYNIKKLKNTSDCIIYCINTYYFKMSGWRKNGGHSAHYQRCHVHRQTRIQSMMIRGPDGWICSANNRCTEGQQRRSCAKHGDKRTPANLVKMPNGIYVCLEGENMCRSANKLEQEQEKEQEQIQTPRSTTLFSYFSRSAAGASTAWPLQEEGAAAAGTSTAWPLQEVGVAGAAVVTGAAAVAGPPQGVGTATFARLPPAVASSIKHKWPRYEDFQPQHQQNQQNQQHQHQLRLEQNQQLRLEQDQQRMLEQRMLEQRMLEQHQQRMLEQDQQRMLEQRMLEQQLIQLQNQQLKLELEQLVLAVDKTPLQMFLESIKLGHLVEVFEAEELDLADLSDLTDEQFRDDLGLKLGPRAILMHALKSKRR